MPSEPTRELDRDPAGGCPQIPVIPPSNHHRQFLYPPLDYNRFTGCYVIRSPASLLSRSIVYAMPGHPIFGSLRSVFRSAYMLRSAYMYDSFCVTSIIAQHMMFMRQCCVSTKHQGHIHNLRSFLWTVFTNVPCKLRGRAAAQLTGFYRAAVLKFRAQC